MRVSGFVLSAPLSMPPGIRTSLVAKGFSSNAHCVLMAFTGQSAVLSSPEQGADRC